MGARGATSNIALIVLLAAGISSRAAEIKVLSGNEARAAVSELGARFERASGHKLAIRFEVNPAVKRRIEAGEAFDVAVVMPRISGVPGVELVGPIPQELQTWIGFAAGVGSGARESAAARELVRFFTAPAAAPVLRAMGIEPFVE